jgi:hypothetical protein
MSDPNTKQHPIDPLGFEMFDFEEQEREGNGRAHLAESLVKKRPTKPEQRAAPLPPARSSPRLSRGKREPERLGCVVCVCVRQCVSGAGGNEKSGEIKRCPSGNATARRARVLSRNGLAG